METQGLPVQSVHSVCFCLPSGTMKWVSSQADYARHTESFVIYKFQFLHKCLKLFAFFWCDACGLQATFIQASGDLDLWPCIGILLHIVMLCAVAWFSMFVAHGNTMQQWCIAFRTHSTLKNRAQLSVLLIAIDFPSMVHRNMSHIVY